MPRTIVRANNSGINRYMQSVEVRALMRKYADQVAANASAMSGIPVGDPGWHVSDVIGIRRARASVLAAGIQARRSTYKHDTLRSALRRSAI